MANDRNELNDLLANFEPTPRKPRSTTSSGTGRVKPAPPPVPGQRSKEQAADKKTYRNGVYFSNPPQKISQDAAKEKRNTGKRRNARKVSLGDEKPQGNFIVRFFKSKGFRNFIIKLVIIAIVSSTLCFYGIGCINDVLAIDAEDVSVEVRVEEGMTDEQVIDLLKEKDLIHNPFFCKLFTKFFDVDGNFISGVYTLSPKLGVEKMLATMKTDYKSSETIKLTFPEGWTIQQIAEKLEQNDVCTASSFISTLQTVDFSNEYDFIKKIPDKDKKFRVLEGYMYPDTYEFYKGENASSVVRRFLDNFQKRWTDKYQKKADKLGYSIDEIIIMASILQAEAANTKQMPKIASVLYNRLDRPSKYPLLQCDSTEDYLLETIKPTLTSSIEDTQKYIKYRDNYDTYSDACEGLPVGAIGNPGDAAINAALNPANTSYYYFRHDVNGGIYYANSFEQHEANGVKAAKVKKEEY
jgi:UPF0755 protein